MRKDQSPDRKGGGTKSQHRTRQRGFTLLEALVATAVLGAAVVGMLGLLSGALRNADRLQAPEQALLLGRSTLNELISAGLTTQDGGVVEMPFDQKIGGRWNEQFRWEAVATRIRSSPQPVPGETLLARIALDVFWKTGAGREERKLSFETYQLRLEPPKVGP